MSEHFDTIIHQLTRYPELPPSARLRLQKELLQYASAHRDVFIGKVQLIRPAKDSVLFEMYEILSKEPETWVDFAITEFNRIRLAAENAKSRDKESVASILNSFTFFTRQKFNGVERLITTVNQGLTSASKQVVKVCLEVHADLYHLDNSYYSRSRVTIEKFTTSKNQDVAACAKQLIREFDTPPGMQKLFNGYSVYAFFAFITGMGCILGTIQLRNNTFVDFEYIVTAFITGFLLSGISHYILTAKRYLKKPETFAICMSYGLLCSFLLLFVNFKFAENVVHEESFTIYRKGTLAKGRYDGCEQPYVEFIRDSKIKSVTFNCGDQALVDNSDSIRCVIKRGLFNFDILEKKDLIITGGKSGLNGKR